MPYEATLRWRNQRGERIGPCAKEMTPERSRKGRRRVTDAARPAGREPGALARLAALSVTSSGLRSGTPSSRRSFSADAPRPRAASLLPRLSSGVSVLTLSAPPPARLRAPPDVARIARPCGRRNRPELAGGRSPCNATSAPTPWCGRRRNRPPPSRHRNAGTAGESQASVRGEVGEGFLATGGVRWALRVTLDTPPSREARPLGCCNVCTSA